MKNLVRFITVLLVVTLIIGLDANSQNLSKMGKLEGNQNAKLKNVFIPQEAYHESDVKFGPLSGTPEQMARTYLQSNQQKYKMKANLTDISHTYTKESQAGVHVNFEQTYSNIPIYQSDMVVSIDKKNYVEFFASNYKSVFLPPATTTPELSSSVALEAARTYLGVSGNLLGPPSSKLMIVVNQDVGRLTYRVVITTTEPMGDWEVFVDAITGEIYSVNDMIVFRKALDQQKKPDFPAFAKLLPVLTTRPAIQDVVNLVSSTRVESNISRLQAFKPRYAGSATGRDSLAVSRDWLISQMQSYGYTDIVQHDFTYNGNTLQNIVVTKTGLRYPDTMIVIGGHYDAVNNSPGADDNGSGTSLILEAAKVLAKKNFEYTVKFIFFSAEEQGLVGSAAYVNNVAVPGNHKIKVMINADMIGYSGGQDSVKVERDTDNSPSGNNAASAAFTDTLAALTELYSTLKTKITSAFGSDYLSFEDAGYVITGFFEKIENPNYHDPTDSLVYCDINYITQITKSAVAGIAHFGKIMSGSGYVFDPDPLTSALATYGTGGFVDNNDGDHTDLNNQRFLRPLNDLTFSGGLYRLVGPYVNISDFESPVIAPATAAHPDSFRFTRSHDGFEDVNVYHHIDKSQRWIQSLGFTDIQNLPIQSDPHGLNGDDNSHYIPSTNQLAWGDGGVDDAEDVDVILHEYGHAIQHGSKPGWSGSGQQGALGEGFGDYWCESFSRSLNYWLPTQAPYFWVFDWDGHNPFWAGRVLNYTPLYPGGLTGAIHTDGQMWSTDLMKIWNEIGREVTDKIVLQSHFYMPSSGATMTQNADAVIQADRDLYGGIHVPVLVYHFGQRGFINPANYVPNIVHTPRGDSENPNGPYPVTAQVYAGGSPLDSGSIKVYWGRHGAIDDSVQMTTTANPNEWTANIPGNADSSTYRYHIYAKDQASGFATHPTNAPTNFHQFYVGQDITSPVITHTALRNQPEIRWPATVRATVTDNIGVDSVWVDYTLLRGPLSGSFELLNTSGNNFEAAFPLDTSQVEVGDTIEYKIYAKDVSSSGNITSHPVTSVHRFAIISTKGIVWVIDDDGTAKTEPSDKGDYEVDASLKGVTGRLIQRTLTDAGYIVDTTSFALHDPVQYPNYDIVVWTGGTKGTGVFGDAAKRTALVNRANSGGKIWVEGGEAGYVYRSQTTEVDANFRRRVLHDSTWLSDVTSSNLVITQPSHALFNVPNTIPSSVAFTGTSIGSRDAVRLIPGDAGAYKIAGWSVYTTQGPDTCGLIVYDDNPNPLSAQIIFMPFALSSVTDTSIAKKLIENTAEYLLTPEPPPTGSLAGVVTLQGTSDYSGVKVKLQGIGLTRLDSVETLADGAYSFTDLYVGTYRITVSKTGYVPNPSSRDTIVGTDPVTGFNFALNQLLSTTVSGTVTLAGQTDHSGVTVQIVGQGISDVTNSSGAYVLSGVNPGSISVRATKAGYRTTTKDTSITNGENMTLNLNMPVETILVNETFETVAVDGIPTGWTRVDVNGDGNTWKTVSDALYNITPGGTKGIKYTYNFSNAANDWLITPALELEGGVPHRVTFYYRTNSTAYLEKIEVMYGTAADPASLTNMVWRKEDIADMTFAKAQATLVVPTTGTYYVAWHVYSAANAYNPGLDDIKIEVAPDKDIGVTKLWVLDATEYGKAFQQPDEKELAAIREAEIREAELAGKVPNPSVYVPWIQPPSQFEEGFGIAKEDSVVLFAELMNFGTAAQSTFNVQWKIDEISQTSVPYTETLLSGTKDTVRLVWNSPSVGLHSVVAYTDLFGDLDITNDSAKTSVNIAPPGIILTESFEGGTTLPPGWSTADVIGTAANWTVQVGTGTYPSAPPYNGNNHMKFNSFSATSGTQERLTTKRLALPAGGSRMAFYMYHDPGYTTNFDSVTVQITTGDSVTGPWTRLGNYIRYNATQGWRKDSVDLLAFGDQPKVFISFLGTSRYGNNIYLDLVEVYPYEAVDFVTVIAPNGGEVLLVGTQQNISWNSYGTATVNIDYTTDNGTSWNNIATGLPAKTAYSPDSRDELISDKVNKGSYLWTIPNTASALCKVRVTSATNPSLTDMSDNTFSIVTELPTGWTVNAPASDAISRPHAAFVRIDGIGHVFVMGGGTPVTTNRKYNTETDSWSSAAALPTASATGGASTVKEKIYSVGGNATGAVQEYNPGANSWTARAAVSAPYYDFGIVTWNDSLIYVIGGDNGGFTAPTGASSSVRYYNPTTNIWATATSIPVALGKMGSGIIDNTIIIAGGWTDAGAGVASAYRGDINPANPAVITWTSIADYPAGALSRPAGAGLTNGNGVVFTGGLITGTTATALTHLYSLTTNSWSALPNMPTARANMSAQLANNGVDYMWAVCGYSTVALNNNERFYLQQLAPPEPHVRVIYPNGGEWLQVGQQVSISWSQYEQNTVKIEYSTNAGSTWLVVTESTPAKTIERVPKLDIKGYPKLDEFNKGTYQWTIPNTPSTNALIKVTSNDNPSLFDVSNSVFTISINPPPPPPGWTVQTSGITTALQSVKAVSDQVAWACGDGGVVLRTINSGTNWTSVTSPSTLGNNNVEALDADIAFVCANGTDDARIYRTTNGGTSWTIVYQSTATGAFVNFVKMFDSNNGYAQGDPTGSPLKYTLLKTTNGGATWIPAADLAPASSTEYGWNNSHHWVSATQGWFGTNNNRIYYTTNSGANWTAGTTALLESPSVFFKNTSDGLAGINAASNATPTIAKSTNGGSSWANITSPVTGRVYGLHGVGDKVFATSAANIIKTTDFGSTWSTSYTGSGTYYHLSFVSASSGIYGWTVSSTGSIVRYYEYTAPAFATISGMKFNDLNGNGIKDQGEPGLENWEIQLSGATQVTTLTGSDGSYSFNQVSSGTYTISEELKTGWVQTAPQGGTYEVTVAAGEIVSGKNFGNFQLGSISGVKFEDLNGNGVKDQGEPGLENWTIKINDANPVLTGPGGSYTFSDLNIGTYTITEELQTGWQQTLPVNPNSYSIDIDMSGQSVVDKDFGNFKLAEISGVAWRDYNHNGVKDAGEPGIEGITINLDGIIPANDQSTTTVSGGMFEFSATVDGYTLSAVPLAGMYQTYPAGAAPYNINVTSSGMEITDQAFGFNVLDDSVKYTSFCYDSIAALVNGKIQKAVKKKPVGAYWEFKIPNIRTNPISEVHVEFKNDVKLISSHQPFAVYGGEKKKFYFTGGALAVGETLVIKGYSTKGKVQSIKKYYLGPTSGTAFPGVAAFYQYLELPMPNYANIINEIFTEAGYTSTGLVIGNVMANPTDGGWVRIKKPGDAMKSVRDKLGPHSGNPKFFDMYGSKPFIKEQKSVPPTKHNNKLFAEVLTLKLNIAASGLDKTPEGFGDLIYYNPGNSLHDSSIIGIARQADRHLTIGAGGSTNFYTVIRDINNAFAGVIDTASFSSRIVLKGNKYLTDIPYLRASEDGKVTRMNPLVETHEYIPSNFELSQNYPNPFNPSTTIEFSIPEDALVTMKVYNILGQEVATLADKEFFTEGMNEVTFDAEKLSSGVYFYRFFATGIDENNAITYSQVKKMVLMK